MGLRVRELRKERDISQERLAQLAGVSFKTIARVERTDSASSRTLQRLADALDVTVGELFGDAA